MSRQKTIQLSNLGSVDVSSITIAVDLPYRIVTHTCSDTLVIGQNCTIVVSYSPTATGTANTNMTVSYRKLRRILSETYALEGVGLALTRVSVTGVYVSGSTWSATYLAELDRLILGHTSLLNLGYALLTGTTQTEALVWHNINKISIKFSQNVDVESNDLILESSSNGSAPPSISSFSYDSTQFIATWTLSASLVNNKYKITLLDTITNAADEPLDGEWTKSISSFPSGDGFPGGDFVYQFHVLIGDIDHSSTVTASEPTAIQLVLGFSVGGAGYQYLYDLDGSGGISFSDPGKANLNLGVSLDNYTDP